MTSDREWSQSRAAAAARRWCADAGFDPAALALVQFRQNAVFRHGPAGLAVRVYGPEDSVFRARLMADVADWLAGADFPAARLAPGPAARPACCEGLVVSAWQWIESSPANAASPAALGHLLRGLHSLSGRCPAATRPFDPLAKIRARLDQAGARGCLDAKSLGVLRDALTHVTANWVEHVAPSDNEPLLLHGDAHPGNVVVDVEGNAHLIDFDSAVRAPREWDLAPSLVAARDAGRPGDWQCFREAYGTAPAVDEALLETMALAKALSITVVLGLNVDTSTRVRSALEARLAFWTEERDRVSDRVEYRGIAAY